MPLISHFFKLPVSTVTRQVRYRHTDLYRRHDDDDGYGDWEEEPRSRWREWIHANRRRLQQAALVASGAGAYYWWHLEEAPITGRRRFIQVGEKQEAWMAKASFQEIMEQYGPAILPPHHRLVRHVQRVSQRIIEAIPEDLRGNTQYRVYVIDAPKVANAFVLPGGEIFVFTGILPICATEAGLAAVIGHEVAHQVARHAAERVSLYQFVGVAWLAIQVLLTGDFHMPMADLVKNLFLFLPFSRKCEREADYIGLLFMARACYDPSEAANVWRRMMTMSDEPNPPAFLSTHPSHQDRIKRIEAWLPEAQRAYEDAGCHK